MSELDESGESEPQIGGGRASVDSVNEFLKEFKSARMSFEPLDTWLFVKPQDDNSNDVDCVSDNNDISATSESGDISRSESDSSAVYHFDSDEMSSCDSADDDDAADTAVIASSAASVYAFDDYDKGRGQGKTLIVRNLASSPGRSGSGIKVFNEADQSDVLDDDDNTSAEVSLDYDNSSLKNSIESVKKHITDSYNICSVNHDQSTVYGDEICSNYAPVTTDHENITHRTSTCSKNIWNDYDIMDNFDSSLEKPSELVVDASSVIHRFTNQKVPNIELRARRECDDSIAVCSCANVNTDTIDTLKCKKKRDRIAQELLDTEATYQRHLELILQNFEDPLTASGLLPSQAVSAIFGNVREIIGINRELMKHLSTKNVGEAFLLLGPFLKLYSTYANNHEHALASLMDYEQKFPEFASFRRRQEDLPVMNGLKLNALLITPVQRIPRYKLLLTDLLKNTLPNDDDYAALTEAVRQVSDVAKHINDHIKQQDNFMRMLAIQKSLACPVGPRILVPGRIFIKEGQLKKVSKRSSVGRMDERTFFLFSDILMYAKPRLLDGAASGAVRAWGGVGGSRSSSSSSPSLVCCCIMPLHHCRVERVFGQRHGTENSAQGTLFSITCKQESVLLLSDQKTVNSWIDALTKAIHSCQLSRQTLRKTSSAKEPMRTRGIARMWKAEKHSDRLLAAVTSPERPRSRTGETSSTPSSPGRLLSRFLFASGDKEKSPAACSSPAKSSRKHPILSCLSSKSCKRQRHVEPLSPNNNAEGFRDVVLTSRSRDDETLWAETETTPEKLRSETLPILSETRPGRHVSASRDQDVKTESTSLPAATSSDGMDTF